MAKATKCKIKRPKPYQGTDKPKKVKTVFAVDESGDPTFYDKKGRCIVGKDGCSSILIMGCIYTNNSAELRKAVMQAREKVLNDPLIKPFIKQKRKDKFFFHAKDDRSEIRKIFFETLNQFDFKARFVVARKDEVIFKHKHLGKEGVFYDDMITRLFTNILYRSHKNTIYFSKRGQKTRQEPMRNAIQTAINRFEEKSQFKIENQPEIFVQVPTDEPLLEVVDYMNWAVYRAFTDKTEAGRVYLDFVLEKVKLIADIYDYNKNSWKERYYNHKTNKFSTKKISPVGLGSGIASVPHRNDGHSPSQD